MLRVFYSDSNDGQRWTLCGRLAGAWVDELRSCWRATQERATHARVVLDLHSVTYIDEAGEELLAEMHAAGVEFVASGIQTKHLLAELTKGQAGKK